MMHARTMQFGNGIFGFCSLAAISMIFHVNTAEEYYSGILILKKCNGVSDLSFILYGIMIVAGIFGNDVYLIEIYNGWCINNLISIFITVSQIVTAILT